MLDSKAMVSTSIDKFSNILEINNITSPKSPS